MQLFYVSLYFSLFSLFFLCQVCYSHKNILIYMMSHIFISLWDLPKSRICYWHWEWKWEKHQRVLGIENSWQMIWGKVFEVYFNIKRSYINYYSMKTIVESVWYVCMLSIVGITVWWGDNNGIETHFLFAWMRAFSNMSFCKFAINYIKV